MIQVNYDIFDAPAIAKELKTIIDELPNQSDYVLSLQLDYRDCNTIFYLNKITEINFKEDMLQITQDNRSHAFFDYKNILEYCVINAEDVVELGV